MLSEAGGGVVRVGIFAKMFPRPSLGVTLDAVKAHGICCVQFNMSCAGLPTMPEEVAPGLAGAPWPPLCRSRHP